MQAARLTEGASQSLREVPWKGCRFCISVNEEGEGVIDDEGQRLNSITEHSMYLFIYSPMENV